MNESQIFSELIGKGGLAGILFAAVWYVAKKLTAAYEARIQALERASEVCEKDRVELRTMILQGLTRNGATLSLSVNSTRDENERSR